MPCSLNDCLTGTNIDDQTTRVDIKAALSKSFLSRGNHLVAWKRDGNATFHKKCWDFLLQQSQKFTLPPRKRRRSDTSQTNLDRSIEAAKVIEASETAEFHDAKDEVKEHGRRITELINKSRHCIFFTGAGISTAAGIGDYRGKDGKWTEMDREVSEELESTASEVEGVPYEDLRPTLTHEAIAKLVERNLVNFVISQNCDDLHGLSGIPRQNLSELHGNCFVEWCPKCKRRYSRDYYVMDDEASEYYELSARERSKIQRKPHWIKCKQCGLSHHTGRVCEDKECGEWLIDSIINFRDDLEEEILTKAFTQRP